MSENCFDSIFSWCVLDSNMQSLYKIIVQEQEFELCQQLDKTMLSNSNLCVQLLSSLEHACGETILQKFVELIISEQNSINLKLIFIDSLKKNCFKFPSMRIFEQLQNFLNSVVYLPDKTIRKKTSLNIGINNLLVHLLDFLFHLDNILTGKQQNDDQLCQITLILFQKNDIDYNQYDESYYLSQILKFLLKSKNQLIF